MSAILDIASDFAFDAKINRDQAALRAFQRLHRLGYRGAQMDRLLSALLD